MRMDGGIDDAAGLRAELSCASIVAGCAGVGWAAMVGTLTSV